MGQEKILDMPLLKLETTANLSELSRTGLLTKLSRIVAETIGKPEEYVMVTVSHSDIQMLEEDYATKAALDAN
jgi:hypothetical protein